jgi:hypothetical protein
MALPLRYLRSFGAFVATLLTCGVMAWWSQRISLLYLAIPASLALAVAYWTRVKTGPLIAVFLALAVACAVGPVDLEFHRMTFPSIRLLRVSYGIWCVPDTVCRGCVMPRNAARYAVVVSVPW